MAVFLDLVDFVWSRGAGVTPAFRGKIGNVRARGMDGQPQARGAGKIRSRSAPTSAARGRAEAAAMKASDRVGVRVGRVVFGPGMAGRYPCERGALGGCGTSSRPAVVVSRARGQWARARVATGDDRRTRSGGESERNPPDLIVSHGSERRGRQLATEGFSRRGSGDAMVVRGGNRLNGLVEVSGSKNAVLALLAATLLADSGKVNLKNVPTGLTDVGNMVRVLESLGATASQPSPGTLELDCSRLSTSEPDPAFVGALRASFLVAAPLLGRLGEATVSLPGGCKIGTRPVDLHLFGLRRLGATVEVGGGSVRLGMAGGALRGADVHFDYPSVGATETVLMAAAVAAGTTTITNAAREPEVEDLGRFLSSLVPGCSISGLGTGTIVVEGSGGQGTRSGGVAHYVIPDRIEAGTFLACGAIAGSDGLVVSGVRLAHVQAIADVLQEMGCEIHSRRSAQEGSGDGGDSSLCDLVVASPGPGALRSVPSIETSPYPGFPTDMQPLLCSVLATSRGKCVVTETVFESRMSACRELRRLGASIEIASGGSSATITGKGLVGAEVKTTDLRQGVALVVAGLAASGETVVRDLSHVDRGYVGLETKLAGIGADVTRVAME